MNSQTAHAMQSLRMDAAAVYQVLNPCPALFLLLGRVLQVLSGAINADPCTKKGHAQCTAKIHIMNY
jgi:hypothetical protein